jgi:hypothetical protein
MTHPLNLITLRGDREAAKQIEGIHHANDHAERMMHEGKITAAEKREFEAQMITEMMKQLPMEAYAAMRKDGRWEAFERLASHDGKRSGYDVTRERNGIVNKVMRDATTLMWEEGVIDDETLKQHTQRLGVPDDLQRDITDKDEMSAIDTYILNKFGDADFRQYRDDVKKASEVRAADDPEDSTEVPADDVADFQARYNIEPAEPAEASADQSDSEAAPAEEPRAV